MAKGFQKGNKHWQHSNCIKTQFQEGSIPWNYKGGVGDLPYKELRKIVLTHSGGKYPKCKRCDYKIKEALTIDHINNDGSKHRKEIGSGSSNFYKWLINNNFPTEFQILCRNCNHLKYLEYLKVQKIKNLKSAGH